MLEQNKLARLMRSCQQRVRDGYGNLSLTVNTILELLDEIEQYRQAEQDERVVVLPCKVGDAIFEVSHHHKCAGCPDNECLPVEKCKLYRGECERESTFSITKRAFSVDDFSLHTMKLRRNLFLTREEAERALEEMNNGK